MLTVTPSAATSLASVFIQPASALRSALDAVRPGDRLADAGGGDGDDAAEAALPHGRQQAVGDAHAGKHHRLELSPPEAGIDVGSIRRRRTATVQHQNIDLSECGGEPIEEGVEDFRLCKVERKAGSVRADFRCGLGCGFFVAAGQRDRNAFRRERFGDTAPEPLAAAENERPFAANAEIHIPSSCFDRWRLLAAGHFSPAGWQGGPPLRSRKLPGDVDERRRDNP
jgi:hypothetical protein